MKNKSIKKIKIINEIFCYMDLKINYKNFYLFIISNIIEKKILRIINIISVIIFDINVLINFWNK